MAKYLVKADFTSETVINPYMLRKGGEIATGMYVRTRRNMLKSPRLLRRISNVASAMIKECSLADACTTNPDKVGTVRKGKVVKLCDPEEVKKRIAAARECAIKVLPGA